MKKIIQTLITFSILFFGINGVKADEYEGTCELQKESTGECTYSCKFEKDLSNLTFDYHSFFKGSNLASEIMNAVVKNDGGLSDPMYFGPSGQVGSYIPLIGASEISVGQAPSLTSFYNNDDVFTCPTIIPKNNVSVTNSCSTGICNTVWKNDIIFTAKKKDTSDVTPDYDAACGLLGEETSETVIFLKKAYRYLKVLLPILIITLGIVDFVKVVVTGKDDDMKKAIKRLTTRIVVAVVFVLVPVIIQILINISGLKGEYSGINDGIKAMLCILG